MKGSTQKCGGKPDMTFMSGVTFECAGRIHAALCKKRKAGQFIRTWRYYPDFGQFTIEWQKPLFGN